LLAGANPAFKGTKTQLSAKIMVNNVTLAFLRSAKSPVEDRVRIEK
jgi:hypothetical protein